MAFATLNGFDVEHASNLLVYENLFPEIQHLNNRGVTDKYTQTKDVKSITYIDVMRVLPYAPRFRKVGSTNNGKWHNTKNIGGYNNAAESEHYTIPVDLWYDEGVPIMNTQSYSNPVMLKSIVMAQLIKAAGMSINVITHAKQWEGFFRDSFSATPTSTEIASSIFDYDSTLDANKDGSVVDAFIAANAELTDGVVEIGAMIIPMEERQAFISTQFDRLMKRQYQTNASEAAAAILATGYINPFTGKDAKIQAATGLAGMYDGVPMYLLNKVIRGFMYVALGIDKDASAYTTSEITTGADLSALVVADETFATKVSETAGTYTFTYDGTGTSWQVEAADVTLADYGITVTGTPDDADVLTVYYTDIVTLLDKFVGNVIYGAGTVRGIVGPSVEVNKHPFQSGIYIIPQMKVGVEVLSGKTIKFITTGELTSAEVKAIRDSIEFTPIDGSSVTANDIFGSGVFNSNASN